MSWEEFDNMVLRAVREIAVYKKLNASYNYYVTKIDFVGYLMNIGYDSDISMPVILSMTKLKLDKRVIGSEKHIGVGSILPNNV
jgi:hypothetical protein